MIIQSGDKQSFSTVKKRYARIARMDSWDGLVVGLSHDPFTGGKGRTAMINPMPKMSIKTIKA